MYIVYINVVGITLVYFVVLYTAGALSRHFHLSQALRMPVYCQGNKVHGKEFIWFIKLCYNIIFSVRHCYMWQISVTNNR